MQETRRATTKVDAVDFLRYSCRPFLNPLPCRANLFCQCCDVCIHSLAAENVRGEIAVAALRATERDGNINSERIGIGVWHTRAPRWRGIRESSYNSSVAWQTQSKLPNNTKMTSSGKPMTAG